MCSLKKKRTKTGSDGDFVGCFVGLHFALMILTHSERKSYDGETLIGSSCVLQCKSLLGSEQMLPGLWGCTAESFLIAKAHAEEVWRAEIMELKTKKNRK